MQADVVQVEAMAAAARHSGGISASVEELVSLKLFEHWLANLVNCTYSKFAHARREDRSES